MRYILKTDKNILLFKLFIFFMLVFVFSFELKTILSDMDFLNVKKVEITGNNFVPKKIILYLSEITKEKNIIKINVAKSKAMIETHPFIKAVGISYKDLIFNITVKERQPFIFLKNGDNLLVLDKEGYVLQDKSFVTDFDLPVLTGIKKNISYEVGEKIKDKDVLYGLKWFVVIPIEFWPDISEINISKKHNIVIYTLEGVKIYVDYIKTLRKKFEILYRELLKLKEKKYRIEYIDLRFGNNIYIKYK
jgi:cell division septal protein FtsQ